MTHGRAAGRKDVVRKADLTDGHILRSLAHLATPMLVTAVLQTAQSLIDLFWVGNLGSDAIASVAMSGTILMVLFPMLMGISTGTTALVSRAVGARRMTEASAATSQSLLLAMVLGGLSGLIGWLFCGLLVRLLGADPKVAALGAAYLRISMIGSFTVFVLFIGNAALQAAGDTVTPMRVMAAASLLNIVLDPIFIFGLGPFDGMGVRGAALATVLSQAIAASISVRILFSGRKHLHLRLPQWKPHPALAWRILRVGIPGSAQMLSRSLMSAVMMSIVASCGMTAVAAYGVGLRFHMMILMPAFALGGAAATMVGQNLGAKKPDRANHAAWLATGIDAAFMAVAAIVMVAFAPTIIRVFNSEADVVRIGSNYLRTVSPFYVFAALGIVLGRSLHGAGDTVAPMVITIITLWVFQVPLAILFSHIWDPATQGIWWAMAVAFVVQGVLVAAWYSTGRWKKKRV